MEILIKLNKRLYKNVKHHTLTASEIDEICDVITNGTPLPKGHGRLKDIDAFIAKVKADRKHSAYLRSWTADDVLQALNNSYAPTIIEADKEDKE